MNETIDLKELREGYRTSDESAQTFIDSKPALVGNEFIASGKDTLARELRPGEIEGVDMVHSPIEEALQEVRAQRYVEWEPLRNTEINGTHIDEIVACMESGHRPIKDVEPSGQVALRKIDPDIRAIYPLPDLESWTRMIQQREGLPGKSLKAFLSGDVSEKKIRKYIKGGGSEDALIKKHKDLVGRLKAASEQAELIWRLDLHTSLNTLFVVNRFGSIGRAASLSLSFLRDGEGISHISAPDCLYGSDVLDYLGEAYAIATDLIDASKG